jgi:WD40 repeat protein
MALRGWSRVWIVALALGIAPALAQQAPPPQEPILRIDPGMHTSIIQRIGVDAACTLLATGSHDKTVRLWRLPDGKLQRTLRLPVGPGHDGKVFAVAVAPDGSWVAAGGWDAAYTSMRANFVYVFDAATGALAARLGPLGDSITHLVVSPDGRYLAATLKYGHGLRVWERTGPVAGGWRLVAEDRDYGGQDAYGAAFDRAGVLYTVAFDGQLRRYGPGYRGRPTVAPVRGGRNPYSVAVHPSGDRVAVSYQDNPNVEVYDARMLSWLHSADTRGIDNGNLFAVTWSPDGTRLLAGGIFNRGGPFVIRVWDRIGQGPSREIEGPTNTILHMLPCGSNIAVGSADPAFALMTPDGQRLVWQEAVQADLRSHFGEGLSLSPDGRKVRFQLGARGKNPVLFELAAEQLSEAVGPPSALDGPDTRSVPVVDWFDNPTPKVGGIPLRLEQHEWSRALAIAPGGQTLVIGAEWSLRGFDRSGRQLWLKQAPSTVWSVNIPRDGKVVVAGYGDGTVRWHRLSDGEELLALFVHAKDRRWVAWTPKGYYMASPGAESLIGWHLNRGWDETAQFFSVDRFREQFNRPDIVKGVLDTLDESRTIEAANSRAKVKRAVEDVRAIAPPIVLIQKPGDNTTFRSAEVTLEYFAFSPTGKRITDVDVRINNASLGARAAVPINPLGNEPIKLTLTLPPEDVTITLVAREDARASAPAVVRLRWDGAKAGQASLPRLRALFVGVNAYKSANLTKLGFAAKDANDLATFFKGQEGKTYGRVESKLLADATRIDVLDGLEWMEKGSEEGDVNLLFLAGHGITDEQQQFYYLASDSDPDKARATGVSRDEILRTIRNRKGSMVVMLDTCHSGDTAPSGASRVDMNRLVNELGDKSLGVFLYASALGRQFSYENAEWGNGAFTKAMLEGLTGKADRDKLGYVETDELAVYVRRRVMAMTQDRQEPVRMKPDATPEIRLVLIK